MMHSDHASPSTEHLWADEVRRLHALWHRGPPRRVASPKPKPSAATGLGLSNSDSFKKAERRRKAKEKRMLGRAAKKLTEQLNLSSEDGPHATDPAGKAATSASLIEWPCNAPPVPVSVAGWEDTNQKPALFRVLVMPPSQEDQRTLHVQHKAVRVFQAFLTGEGYSSGEEMEDDDNDDEEDGNMEDDGDGGGGDRECSGCFKFFLGLFEEEGDLRAYYVKNWEKGEFCCLVCEGIGVKVGKKFVSCVALVQHSSSIMKTKRKKSHRAFGRAICKVLSWDITRLPSVVLDMAETLGQTLAKTTDCQVDIHMGCDQILVDAPKIGGSRGGEHDGCLEIDNFKMKFTETPLSGVRPAFESSALSLPETESGNCVRKLLPSGQNLPTSQEELPSVQDLPAF